MDNFLQKHLEQDKQIQIKLDNNSKLLNENDYNVIIDSNEQFIKERNNSKKYKLYGKIKMIFRNQYSGKIQNNFRPLLRKLYLEGDGTGINKGYLPYDEFALIRNDVSYPYNDKPNGNDLVNYTPNNKLKNVPEHILIGPMNNTTHNWGTCLTYVFDKDENYIINYTFSNGTIS